MKTLNDSEVNQVSGGLLPAIAAGIAGAYMYEAMGGKAGIDNYFANGWASTKSSVKYWYRKLTDE